MTFQGNDEENTPKSGELHLWSGECLVFSGMPAISGWFLLTAEGVMLAAKDRITVRQCGLLTPETYRAQEIPCSLSQAVKA